MIKLKVNNKNIKDVPNITIVVDGMNEFYKNYFKMKNFIGEDVAAFFGTIRSVLSYRKMGKVIVIWESKSSKRISEDKNYKANRIKMSDNFYEQLNDCKQFLTSFVVNYKVVEYEADDMMATIAWLRHLKGEKTMIVSSDDDMQQMLNENISIYNASKKIIYNLEKPKYKVNPKNFIMLWALEGDASDNIIGIKGIRKKEELVEKYFYNEKQILNESDLKILLDNFIFELNCYRIKDVKVIENEYNNILNNMNLLRLRIVPKENYSKIEKTIEPDILIKKYKCNSFYKYLDEIGGNDG